MMVMYCAINFYVQFGPSVISCINNAPVPYAISNCDHNSKSPFVQSQTEDYHGQILLCIVCSIKLSKLEE